MPETLDFLGLLLSTDVNRVSPLKATNQVSFQLFLTAQ